MKKTLGSLLITCCLLLPGKVLADTTVTLPKLKNLTKWDDLNSFLSSIPNILFMVLGVVFIFAIVYGGYMYLTAQGDENRTTLAKHVFIFAIIGLIIVIGAYALVNFLIGSFNL